VRTSHCECGCASRPKPGFGSIEVDTSLGGMRVVRVLEELKQRRGLPRADPQRQRTRVREPCRRSMGLRTRPAVAHDPTRTTDGERLRGKRQRAVS
jgi:hypothetical protein